MSFLYSPCLLHPNITLSNVFSWLVTAYLRAALLCCNSAVLLLPLVRSFLLGDGENISHKFEASQLMSFMELKTETPTKLITHLEFTCVVLYLCVCVFCTNVYIYLISLKGRH